MTKKIAQGKGENTGGTDYISCAPQVVPGVDTIEIHLWLNWLDSRFFEALQRNKELAQEGDDLYFPCSINSKEWNISRTAHGLFTFCLSFGDVTLMFSRRNPEGKIPNCKIKLGSIASQNDIVSTVNELKFYLRQCGANWAREVVSRLDLSVDLVGQSIEDTLFDNEDFWICNAHKFTIYRTHRRLSGMQYGKGDIVLRIYDKVGELKEKQATAKQLFFAEKWGLKTYDEKPTTRIEFQARRAVLREFGQTKGKTVDTFEETVAQLDSLWLYFTKTWARHNKAVVDRKNKNQSKAKLSDCWCLIAKPLFGGLSSAKRIRVKTVANIDAMLDQARGLMVAIVASKGLDMDDYFGILGETSRQITDSLSEYMSEKYQKFAFKFNTQQIKFASI